MNGSIGPVFRLITAPGRFVAWMQFHLPGRWTGDEERRDSETWHLVLTVTWMLGVSVIGSVLWTAWTRAG